MFYKTAKASILGSWQGGNSGSITRTAGLEKTSSYFLQQAGKIDIEAAINDVADEYQISKNPKDYLLLPVRANSCQVPNENGDAFSRQETLRFDHKIGRRVYQTYLLKPHHVNHRAENPRMARGLIVDAHFNDVNPMPEEWKKRYEAATGEPQDRDMFVEALLAVDTKKDPYLAKGLKSGVLKAFSMGCECEATRCSVCNHRAASRLEFCDHIRYGNKMRWFDNPKNPGHKIQAFENCEGVVYSELSAVDQPADPRALASGEVFQLSASLQKMSREDLIELIAFTKINGDRLPKVVAQLIEEALS